MLLSGKPQRVSLSSYKFVPETCSANGQVYESGILMKKSLEVSLKIGHFSFKSLFNEKGECDQPCCKSSSKPVHAHMEKRQVGLA